MRTPRPVPSRRGLLRVAAAAPLAVLLAACGTDTSDRYASGEAGYVSGTVLGVTGGKPVF